MDKVARDKATELKGMGILMGARMHSTAVIRAIRVNSVVFISFPPFLKYNGQKFKEFLKYCQGTFLNPIIMI
jgi:hypothetical protein